MRPARNAKRSSNSGRSEPLRYQLTTIGIRASRNSPSCGQRRWVSAASALIRAGFSAELDGVVNTSAHAREWVASLEPRERERSGIPSWKLGVVSMSARDLSGFESEAKGVKGGAVRLTGVYAGATQ